MKTILPPAIAAFFKAHNTGQTAGFSELFTEDAIVNDEEHEYRGDAITQWIQQAHSKYQPHAEVIDLSEAGGQTVASAQVSGDFPGSPIQLSYHFTLNDGRISALSIA